MRANASFRCMAPTHIQPVGPQSIYQISKLQTTRTTTNPWAKALVPVSTTHHPPAASRYASTLQNPPPSPSPQPRQTNPASQTLTIPNPHSARTLSFAEYGPQTGFPLLYFHGYPSSRLEARALTPLAHRLHLRIIAPDRPGFGRSTYAPSRRIVDWPADVRALADHLGLARFAVLGGSGGGPYALACASEGGGGVLGGDGRLVGVGVLAGAGPWWGAGDVADAGISMPRRVLAEVARRWPAGLEGVSDFLVSRGRWVVGTGVVERWLDRWLDAVEGVKGRPGEVERGQEGKTTGLAATNNNDGDDDNKPSNDKERREQFLQLIFEAFAQGSAGFVQETQLLTADDWGFRFEDVRFRKVLMWHGTADANSPIGMIRYMAERIPHCVLREFEGVDHYSLLAGEDGAGRLEAILRELVPAEMVRGVN
ncbi:hypothetical protein GX51_08005 [Blastomyces parvus]|uniref:AB hydrolase-1 domain-containing protein n=1 Tax=Blastomyces parvus TaxID=2060905 RepID=A0A2B7WH26_9EURO|nr:hypothetical protein GX51_08005 [Blastomyces parvus]